MSVRDVMHDPAPPETVVWLRILGPLRAEHDRLSHELATVTEAERETFAGTGAAKALAEQIKDVEDRCGASGFHLRPLRRMRPLMLMAEHKPREGNERDAGFGFNSETYFDALIKESCTLITEPGGETLDPATFSDDEWGNILDSLTHGQWDQLVGACDALNGRNTTAPTSALASVISQANGESSKQPEPGVSPRSGSKGGSRRGSRKSSETTKVESFA